MAKELRDGQVGMDAGDVRLPKLSHLVAGQLRTQILNGQLRVGDNLPPESELLALFQVSRPTLREALRILESESLLTIGRGIRSGARISKPNSAKATEYATSVLAASGVTILDLHQARTFFEPELVRQIAVRRLPEEVATLRARAEDAKLASRAHDLATVVACANQFHEAIADLSGNHAVKLFIGILRNISDDVYSRILASEPVNAALKRNTQRSARAYAKLCDLIEMGTPSTAAGFWRKYMEDGLPFLISSHIGDRVIALHERIADL